MTHPLELSDQILATGEGLAEGNPLTNRVTNELSELRDDLSIVESFSHVITARTDDGLVCFDSSGLRGGARCVEALRGWSTDRVHTIVYTHGHVDHVGGSGAFAADAANAGHAPPEIVGHERVKPRFERYDQTSDYNLFINHRQFGGVSDRASMRLAFGDRFLPADTMWPTTEYVDTLTLDIGDRSFELHHDKGETDDHTWAWVPDQRAIFAGDLVLWVFPNCGNPQKVQRYPLEWAQALRKMQAKNADLLVGAHGLPVQGEENVNRILDDAASVLESLVERVVAMMNDGEPLDAILHSVKVPEDILARPWLRPVYDEPEFVVRNIWRLYGGWWDLDPSTLKPAPKSALAAEVAELAGGVGPLLTRATQLATDGEFRLACQLIELAKDAEPTNIEVHGVRAEIYQARRNAEHSLMSKGIYAAAANESRAIADPDSGSGG